MNAVGGKLSNLNEDDTRALAEALWRDAVNDCRALAQSGNCVDEMETVLQACADFLDLPLN